MHLIGPLQSNKTKDAVALFDVIETVDRDKIARTIAAEIRTQERKPGLYVQVNTGSEPQKAGIAPGDIDSFIAEIHRYPGLDVAGLMCIPPLDEEAALHFALLARIGKAAGLKELSMGMSHDFETAIALGATEVRVGSAIFGPRGGMGASG